MSKTRQRRRSNQRQIINPYHRIQTGTALPIPDAGDYALFDPIAATDKLMPYLRFAGICVLAALAAAIVSGVM